MMMTAAVLLLASPGSPADTLWTDAGEGYDITVHYPETALETDVIGDTLQAFAEENVEGFMESYGEYFSEELGMDWTLEMNFTHEPSPTGMVCIIAWMWEYTGGAHGNTWTRAFVYDEELEHFLDPVEILGGWREFEDYTREVRRQLHGMDLDSDWVEEGASNEPETNYHTLVPVPDEDGGIAGYRVIFPPYQVAAYVYGPIEIYVPAD